MDQRDTAFPAFVAHAEPDLLGTALLLTGSRSAARELLVVALARTHRRWRHLGSPGEAREETRDALVRASLRHAGTADAVMVDADGDHHLPEADRTWLRALAALDPRTRAIAVLRLHERLDEPAVAALLSCSTTDVADALAEALAVLGPLLADAEAAPGGAPATPRPAPTPTPGPAVVTRAPADADALEPDPDDDPDGDPDAGYRRPATSPAPRAPRPRPAPLPAPVPVPTEPDRPATDEDPDAIYRRPS
ncbi:hypothetical protein [Modestobacter sp. SYSU DS0511]